MATINCTFEGCGFQCPNDDAAVGNMVMHAMANHQPQPQPRQAPPTVQVHAPQARQPRLDRPIIDLNCAPHEWQQFCRKFERFRIGSEIPAASATSQLLHCLSDKLYAATTRSTPDLEQMSVTDTLAAIKAVAVLPVALGVRQAKALDTKQAEGQRFRLFVDKIRERVVDCNFFTPCTHAVPPSNVCRDVANCNGHDYTDAIIRLIALNGIVDPDIKRETLAVDSIDGKTINQIISIVEAKETARDQTTGASAAGILGHRRNQRGTARQQPPPAGNPHPSTAPPPPPPTHQPPPPNQQVAPRRMRCACGKEFVD